MKTIFRALLFILILILGIGGIAIYWTFYRPLPDYQSTVEQPALEQEVDIHWDSHGVPHIYADNKHDLYYSLGYVHAQDRLWQMTLSQLAAEGRFAEFLGKDLLPYDKLQRTIGFWRIAKKIETTLADSTRQQLQAYADGVNNYIKTHPKSLPIQFTLADMEPIQWTITHSIALARLMAWELNLAWKSELTYAYLAQNLSSRKFADLLPNSNLTAQHIPRDTTHQWAKALFPLVNKNEQLNQLMGTEGSSVGSNAWAVSAQKSATDYPLLAGDPHLGLNMPGKWYEAHLHTGGQNLSGATLAGAPIVILGQNDQLAWSLTNIMLDDTDFFQEAMHPKNPDKYLLDTLAGEPIYEKFETQQEVIKIKNDDDTLFTRRLTQHGPVISEVFPEQKYIDDRVITMRWTGQEITNEIEALFTMNWATNFEEFQRGAQDFKVPGQHFIYADTAGNIARLALANIPIRNESPLLLREGWKPDQDWQGFVPYDELPSNINPDRGWVANANNPPTGKEYPHYISIYWEPDARYDRIRQYLNQDISFSAEAFQQMQNDSYSLYAQEITKIILPVLKGSEKYDFSTVISYLENWDYSYEPSETAASIMDVFLLRLSRNTYEDEMTAPVYKNFVKFSALPERSILYLLRNRSPFFDDINTKDTTETAEQLITKSMNQTVQFLKREFGDEPFEWRWEQLHTITLEPSLFGRAADAPNAPATLKLIVDNLLSIGPHAVRGHDMTINNGEYSWNDPFEMILGPSIRRVVDFSDMTRTMSILPTGQSGNPLSEYYGDQTESWLNGQYKFLYQDSTILDESQYKTMKLIPGNQ
ncbi:penicillin acylase family protein [Fodinibius halophilus]|uniref:Penicillin acylase family protein n=1 Tax=Fodinibius halophilus TaxID=1736908 RepID=A0A6M1T8L8_9BACT|nr:penicillin acylase family protein [Fodinibius halophilus]NGP86732.1 penicillin acylase family protein [Fodinibius halophilus]